MTVLAGARADALVDVRVVERELVAPDVVRLRVVAEGPVQAAAPGAHVDVVVGGLVRQYSLCDADTADGYELGVRLDPASRGGSAAVHRLAVGDPLQVGPVRSTFALGDHAGPVLLLAAGIGITPVLSMARDLARRGRPFTLHHVVRSAAPFGAAVAELGGRAHRGGDRAAVATVLREALAGGPDAVYACGPASWMTDVAALAAQVGAPAPVVESFGAAPAEGAGFTVTVASTGAEVAVGDDESVLVALERAGVLVDSSCEAGVCGTCVTRVLAGRVDHRDQYLTAAEQARHDQMCLCVSRGCGPLVLDL